MYSIVILDDEIHAIQHLKRLLGACASSCEVVATYTDARVALQESVCEKADILFVDIMMPAMDGLVFSERLLQRNPCAKVVLLTAHRDFEFAKQAIEIGVHNYWVKHELRKTNIASQVESVLAAVDEARRFRASLQRQSLIDALSNKRPFSELFADSKAIRRCFLLYLQAPQALRMERLGLPDSIKWLGSFLLNGLQVAAGNMPGGLCSEDLRAELDAALPLFVEGGLLSAFFAPQDYQPAMHDNLLFAAGNCVFASRKILLADGDTLARLQYDASVPRELEKTVFGAADFCLRMLDAKGLALALNPLWRDPRLSLGNRQALSYVENRLEEYITALGLPVPPRERESSIIALRRAFLDALHGYAEPEVGEDSPSFKVRRVRAYIHKHLQGDLQLRTLTREFSISGDYLRKIFKSEMGTTLSEYITHARIEEAKRLLQTGEYKVYEIADLVGYNSTHYFSQVFQKAVGCYPTEYLSAVVE